MFFALGLSSVTAQAGVISTTETTVSYAKETIAKALGEDLMLLPGSIQIDEKQAKIVDLGGLARSVVGRERNEYSVRFKAVDRRNVQYTGRVNLTVEAVSDPANYDRKEDNNTTLRLQDLSTLRNIKVQLYGHEDYPKTITLKELNLKQIETR